MQRQRRSTSSSSTSSAAAVLVVRAAASEFGRRAVHSLQLATQSGFWRRSRLRQRREVDGLGCDEATTRREEHRRRRAVIRARVLSNSLRAAVRVLDHRGDALARDALCDAAQRRARARPNRSATNAVDVPSPPQIESLDR